MSSYSCCTLDSMSASRMSHSSRQARSAKHFGHDPQALWRNTRSLLRSPGVRTWS
jgi:hypothetical protein